MEDEVKTFLINQWPSILTIVVLFITTLSVFSILGVNFNPSSDKVIQKEVVVESFTDNVNTSDAFCKQYSSQSELLNKQCNKLTENNCNSSNCCVWLNGKTCVSGGVQGPNFLTSEGKNVDVNYYSFKNTLFGKV